VRATDELVAAAIQREVDDTSPVEDCILGTAIYGTGHTIGRVSADLAPGPNRPAVDIRLLGTVTSDSVGYNGPVTIYSKGLTTIDARKRVLFDGTGLRGLPATARCRTETEITGIAARLRLIRRIAWKKAAKQKYKAEWIASRHAEQRVAARMDEESREMLDERNDAFQKKFRLPLVRVDGLPRTLDFSTTDKFLFVEAIQASSAQLAAPSDPPPISGEPDLAVRLHQSMVGNFAEAVIRGVKLTDERLAEIVEKQTGEVPEELKIRPDKDPWSITFAKRLPVSVTFGKGTLTVAIRGRQFTRGDQPVNKAVQISANYKLEKTPRGSKLTREGDVQVDYLGIKRRLTVREVALKTFLRKKFDAMFKTEFIGEGIALPEQWERGGKLSLTQMDSGDGWMALGWKLAAEEPSSVD